MNWRSRIFDETTLSFSLACASRATDGADMVMRFACPKPSDMFLDLACGDGGLCFVLEGAGQKASLHRHPVVNNIG